MASYLGADPDRLEELGRQLLSGADWLETTRDRLTAELEFSTWEGPDAEDTRTDWTNSHAPALSLVAVVLRDMSLIVCTNATQQREASTADGGGIGGRPGGPIILRGETDDGWFDDLLEYLGIQGLVVDIGGVLLSVGEIFWPVLKTAGRVVGVLGLAINAFQLGAYLAEGDTGGVILSGLAIGLGGAALIIGAVCTGPIWVAVGIGLGVAALAVSIASNFDSVRDWVGDRWDDVYEWTSGVVSDVADGITAAADAVVDFGETVVEGAADVIEDVGDFASDAIDFGGDVLDAITPW